MFSRLRIFEVFLLLAFLFTCTYENKVNTIDFAKQEFRTTVDSKLFFNNMKSIYYNKTEGANKIDLYTYRKSPKDKGEPYLQLRIADNWLHDEAYVLIEPGEHYATGDTIFARNQPKEGSVEVIYWPPNNRRGQFAFTSTVYVWLKDRTALELKDRKGNWVQYADDKPTQDMWLITLRDYFELINIY